MRRGTMALAFDAIATRRTIIAVNNAQTHPCFVWRGNLISSSSVSSSTIGIGLIYMPSVPITVPFTEITFRALRVTESRHVLAHARARATAVTSLPNITAQL